MSIPVVDAKTLFEKPGYRGAAKALRDALAAGVTDEKNVMRTNISLRDGVNLLLMPAQFDRFVGTKILSINDENSARGIPTIQGSFLLMDRETTTPRAIIDGAALTELRTAAFSLVFALETVPDARSAVLFGYGAQGRSHAEALVALFPKLITLEIAGPTIAKAEALAADIRAYAAEHGAPALEVSATGEPNVSGADLIVCTTSAHEPLFDGTLPKNDAVVIAMGSHSPDDRELDAALLGRSSVVIEEREAASKEAGDIVLGIRDGAITSDDLVTIDEVIRGRVDLPTDRPRVFKTVGTSWQDVVVAAAVGDNNPR